MRLKHTVTQISVCQVDFRHADYVDAYALGPRVTQIRYPPETSDYRSAAGVYNLHGSTEAIWSIFHLFFYASRFRSQEQKVWLQRLLCSHRGVYFRVSAILSFSFPPQES